MPGGSCIYKIALITSIHPSDFTVPTFQGPVTIFLPSSRLLLVSTNGKEQTAFASPGLASFITDTSSIFSHFATNDRKLFLVDVVMPLLLIHLSGDRHVGQFHILAIMSCEYIVSMSIYYLFSDAFIKHHD